MNFWGKHRAACSLGLALGAAGTWTPAAAAQAEAAAEYDLPAQKLGDTLRAIAQASGREILFRSDLVEGRTAPPLKGRMTPDQAMRAALSGTTLVVEHRAGALLVREPTRSASDEPRPVANGNPLTVTGTRIRGAGSTSPVIVNSRRSLEQSGVTDLAEYTRVLPQNFTGGQNPGVAGGGQQGGQSNINNSAALNLRGLGPDATLTLLNGHRLAYDALNQGIDISAIPLAAVDRIEVVADGASALYGSDAVGGVANVILRRDYQGLQTTARFGGSTDGGNVQQQYSAVGGGRWSSGGMMVALDHSRATPIYADQRDYTRGLDRTLTLTQRNSQWSGVLAGDQQLTEGIRLEIDGYGTRRRSLKQSPFLPDASVLVNGLISRPEVRSYAVTPTVRADLPAGWQASLSGSLADSRTLLDTTRYFNNSGSRSLLLYDNRLSGLEANAEGPLFRLPGGAGRLAIGGGIRRVALHENITDLVSGSRVPYQDFTERRTVHFAFGELSLPLVGGGFTLPMIQRLTLSGAVRYEQWKGIDALATPKLGIIYQPVTDFTVRATWGRSFKVPTLDQVHEVPQGVLLPGFIFAPQPQPPLAQGATVLLLGGGNPDLRSERATTWSLSGELKPRFAEGLRLQGTYFAIRYRDRIGSVLTGTLSSLANPLFRDLITFSPTADQVNALIATFPQGLLNQTGKPFDPANVGAIIDDTLRNTARQHIRGLDLAADYRIKLAGDQKLLVTGSASYLKSNQQLSANQPIIGMAGNIFNPPHWRWRTGASWESRRADLSAFVNYVGSTRDRRFPAVENVGSFVTLDLSGSVRTGREAGALRGMEIRLSALNLLNEKPDPIRNSEPEAPSYDSTNQSPIGRFVGLSVSKSW